MEVRADLKEAKINAVIIRADGTKEDLGTIAYHSTDPAKQAEWDEKQMKDETGS